MSEASDRHPRMDERAFRRALRWGELARPCPPLSGAEICSSGREERWRWPPIGSGSGFVPSEVTCPARLLVHAWMPLACRVSARFQVANTRDVRGAWIREEPRVQAKRKSFHVPRARTLPLIQAPGTLPVASYGHRPGSWVPARAVRVHERGSGPGYVTSLGTKPLLDPTGGHRNAFHNLRFKFPPLIAAGTV